MIYCVDMAISRVARICCIVCMKGMTRKDCAFIAGVGGYGVSIEDVR